MARLESFGQREDPQEKKESQGEKPEADFSVLDKPENQVFVEELKDSNILFTLPKEKLQDMLDRMRPLILALGVTEEDIEWAKSRKNLARQEVGALGPLARFQDMLVSERYIKVLVKDGKLNDREVEYVRTNGYRNMGLKKALRIIHEGHFGEKVVVDKLVELGKITRDEYEKFVDVENRDPEFTFEFCGRFDSYYLLKLKLKAESSGVGEMLDSSEKAFYKTMEEKLDEKKDEKEK